MQEFEILDHTSEVRFRAYGDTLEEAFANAGRATFAIMADLDDIRPERSVAFEVQSEDLESLLYDFIDQLIYLRDTEQMLFCDFDVTIDALGSRFDLEVEASGCDMAGIAATDVKAVTYSEMEIHEEEGTYMIQVVLDV